MTVYLEVHRLTKLLTDSVYVHVEGSQSGPLVSTIYNQWKGPFHIICSKNDVVNLRICNELSMRTIHKVFGEATINAARIIEENKYDLEFNKGKQINYEVKAFDSDGKSAGVVSLKVRYDKTQLYQGEKIGVFESLPQKAPVTIYQGRCATKNLFSWMDTGVKDQHFNAMEGIYRDEL